MIIVGIVLAIVVPIVLLVWRRIARVRQGLPVWHLRKRNGTRWY